MIPVKHCLFCKAPHQRPDVLCATCRTKQTRRYRAGALKGWRTRRTMRNARQACIDTSKELA